MTKKRLVNNQAMLERYSSPVNVAATDTSQIIEDLKDTASGMAGISGGCAGMAACQIGELKRIMVMRFAGDWMVLINPHIAHVHKSAGMVNDKEHCLSTGVRSFVKRYKRIDVRYVDEENHIQKRRFSKFNARVVQHLLDLMDGVTI